MPNFECFRLICKSSILGNIVAVPTQGKVMSQRVDEKVKKLCDPTVR